MSMLFSAEKFVSEVNELKDICVKNLDFESVIDMDKEELKTLQVCLKLINTLNELIIEQARLYDEMNNKLDKLLYQVNRKNES